MAFRTARATFASSDSETASWTITDTTTFGIVIGCTLTATTGGPNPNITLTNPNDSSITVQSDVLFTGYVDLVIYDRL